MKPEQLRVRPTIRYCGHCDCGFTSSARSDLARRAAINDHTDYHAQQAADDIRIIEEALQSGTKTTQRT
jgi:hypothetical protein